MGAEGAALSGYEKIEKIRCSEFDEGYEKGRLDAEMKANAREPTEEVQAAMRYNTGHPEPPLAAYYERLGRLVVALNDENRTLGDCQKQIALITKDIHEQIVLITGKE